MPEGDTIFRAARTLHRALGGRVIEAMDTRLAALRTAKLVGRTVERVESKGKHLLIHFDDGSALASHMGMTGSWHIYKPGERWRITEGAARIVLTTDEWVAVCFSAPKIELLDARHKERHPQLGALGPDVLAEALDEAEILRRLRDRGTTPLGEAILAQQVLAGVGNIYKSESLFSARLDPFAPVSAFSDAELTRAVRTARKLMSENLDSAVRTTREGAGGGHSVYKRSAQPCRRCGTRIEMRRQGSTARSTYFCPTCQPRRG